MSRTRAIPLNRRDFLQALALLGGGSLAGCRHVPRSPPPVSDEGFARVERTLEIVVVGAGLAGLVAAYELEALGHRVTILEAEVTHVGGRVRTHRFDDGQYGELGAMRVPRQHQLTRAYLEKFKLPLRPFVLSNPEAYYLARGLRVRQRDVRSLYPKFRLTPQEQLLLPEDFWSRAITRRVEQLTDEERRDLLRDQPESDAVRELDRLSLQQLCDQANLSEDAVELLGTTFGYESVLWSSATENLREESARVWYEDFDEVVGGMDRLPAAFAGALRSKPRMGCAVSRIEQGHGRASAIYEQAGRPARAEADFVICTAPLPVVSRLEFDPPLSPQKQRAVRQVTYDSATKVLAVSRRRFWEADDGIFGGGTFSDLPIGSTYYPADNSVAKDPAISAGPGVLLASYTWSSQQARRMGTLSEADRAQLTLRCLARLHPQAAEEGMISRTVGWAWDSHKWSGGAYTWFSPGQYTRLYRDLLAPEGRVWFAGEHASLAHSWMQGALESGRRAVRELLRVAKSEAPAAGAVTRR